MTTDLKKKKKKKRYFDALNQKKRSLSLSLGKTSEERKSGRKNGVGETVAGWDGRFLLRKWKRGDVLLRGFVDKKNDPNVHSITVFRGDLF